MATITRVVLDVLKPHQPNALEFASQLADLGQDYDVHLLVEEMDDQTQSILLTINGENIDFDTIAAHITAMGASVHSIDEVNVRSHASPDASD